MPSEMKMSRRRGARSARTPAREPAARWWTRIGLLLAAGSAQVPAAQAPAALMVSAYVLPVARMQIVSGIAQVQVSAADVASGYVDAPRGLVLRVESNSRSGFALDVAALSPWYTAVALQGLDGEVVLDGAGGTVVQRWQNSRSRLLTLRARFKLAPTAQPGWYAWPLRLSARPL